MDKCEYSLELAHLEGSKYWFSVLTELQNRSVKDLSIACVDELTGLPDDLETVIHRRMCMVHLVKSSSRYVSVGTCALVATELKAMCPSLLHEKLIIDCLEVYISCTMIKLYHT